MHKKHKKGFTLLEVTIVIAITAVIIAGLVILIDPLGQLNKAKDTKRKTDLSKLQKTLEDWYNDKGCYPRPEEICYDTQQNNCSTDVGSRTNKTVLTVVCHICGSHAGSPDFSPYLQPLPCDPDSTNKDYLYEVRGDEQRSCTDSNDHTVACPSYYRIYSKFGVVSDSDSIRVGCRNSGCGPENISGTVPYGYDYGVTSGNTSLTVSNQ